MLVSRAVVIRCRVVESAIVFGQPDQPNGESGPVFDGDGRECAFVLAEFDGACLSCRKSLESAIWILGGSGFWKGWRYLVSAQRISN